MVPSIIVTSAGMYRSQVSSSVITSVGYDEQRRVLEVQFVSGAVYRYHRVSRDVFEGLLDASSKGTFFNAHIKDEYLWEQVK